MRCLALLLLTACSVAQLPSADELLSKDWRVRNSAARAIHAGKSDEVDDLLSVLRSEWDGKLVRIGLGGGRGFAGPPPREPRERIRLETVEEMRNSGNWWHGASPRIESAADLVVPWHPCELAAWLIERRTEWHGNHPDLQITVDNDFAARVWLLLAAPAEPRIRSSLADTATGRHVAGALRDLHRMQLLRDALATGDAPTRRHVLALGEPALLERDDCLAAAVELMLHDGDDEAVSHVARLVEGTGKRGIAALVAALHDPGADASALARWLGLLCRSEDNSAAHEIALAHLADEDPRCRHRALYVLSKADLAAPLQGDAAKRLCTLIERSADRDTRLLAFDALGRCGAGVTEEQRRWLIAMLEKPPAPGLKARVLGCLQMLGAAREIPLPTKQAAATSVFPTTATFLALADEGEPAADVLETLLDKVRPGVDAQLVADRLARTAPGVLRDWLTGPPSQLQLVALGALRSIEPDSGVPSIRLVEELAHADGILRNEIIGWLAERDDLGELAPRVFASMAARRGDQLHVRCKKFAEKYALPTPRMLEILAPLLRQGHGWELLRDDDRAAARAACRGWHAQAEDDATRARLAAELSKLGLDTEQDIEIVLAALHGEDPGVVLFELRYAPQMPPRVRSRVEDFLEDESGRLIWFATDALLAHRTTR